MPKLGKKKFSYDEKGMKAYQKALKKKKEFVIKPKMVMYTMSSEKFKKIEPIKLKKKKKIKKS